MRRRAPAWRSRPLVHGPADAADRRDTLLRSCPDGLCGVAEWTRTACPFERGDLPAARQISVRTRPDSAVPEWNAYFTAGAPHGALIDFLLAADARAEPRFCFVGPEAVVAVVCAQGRVRDIDRLHTAALTPGLSAGVSLEEVPPLVRGADPRPRKGSAGRRGGARRGGFVPVVRQLQQQRPAWPGVIFASSLASPHRVQRSCLPAGVEGRLTVVRPGADRQRRARGAE